VSPRGQISESFVPSPSPLCVLARAVYTPYTHGKMEDNLKIYTFLHALVAGNLRLSEKRKKMMDICFEK